MNTISTRDLCDVPLPVVLVAPPSQQMIASQTNEQRLVDGGLGVRFVRLRSRYLLLQVAFRTSPTVQRGRTWRAFSTIQYIYGGRVGTVEGGGRGNKGQKGDRGCKQVLQGKKESLQHRHFPCGPPPQYYTGCTQLNFTVRMGRGAFCVIWP